MLGFGQSSASAGVKQRLPRTVSSLAVRLFSERHHPMKALTIGAILAFAAILGLLPANAAEAPQEASGSVQAPITPTTLNQPSETLPARLEPSLAHRQRAAGESCPGWLDIAYQVGWPQEELPMVAAVIYFESRCIADIKGDKDKSFSLMQIHTTSWCRPNRYWPDGYLQAQGIISHCDELMDPTTNLRAGLEIWRVGGWKQWSTMKLASTTLGH